MDPNEKIETFESIDLAHDASSLNDTTHVAERIEKQTPASDLPPGQTDNAADANADPAKQAAPVAQGDKTELTDDELVDALFNEDATNNGAAPAAKDAAPADAAAAQAPVENEAIFEALAKELGFSDVKNKADLVAKVKPVIEAKPEIEYPDDAVKGVVEKIISVAKAGGNYQRVADDSQKINELDSRIKNIEAFETNLQGVLSSDKVEDKKEFLAWYYENELKLKGESLKTVLAKLEEKDDADIFIESQQRATEVAMRAAKQRETVLSEKSTLSQRIDDSLNAAIKQKAQSLKVATEAITNFKDPHGERFTKTVQEVAKEAFGGDPVTVQIPRGLAERLLTKDGKFDINKALNTLASVVTAKDKMIYLSKKAKVDHFRQVRGAGGAQQNPPGGMPAGVTGAADEEWTLG
jgi:hypothetical protein